MKPIIRRIKPWHWLTLSSGTIVLLFASWFALAYGALPRLWSRHEHKHIGQHEEIVSYTAQDIPGDPINLRVKASETAIMCALNRAGWSRADEVSFLSGARIGASVLFGRPYPAAPVSPLFVVDRQQDFAFEKDDGKSADRRHHVRFWQIAPDDWLAAATFDRGVGLSLFTLQITHHIGPDVDGERDAVGKLFSIAGGQPLASESSRIPSSSWHRNGGGDRYRTDGLISVYALPAMGC